MTPRILVAGIGNIFLGDDAFGVEVVRRLRQRAWPDGVRIVDFGIRGFDLAGALLDGWDFAILIDAAPRGGPPGTLYVLEPAVDRNALKGRGGAAAVCAAAPVACDGALDPHSLDPLRVLALADSLGGALPQILVLGCEPSPLKADEALRAELSAPVRAAIAESLALVESLIDRLRRLDPRSQPVSLAALFEGRSDHGSDPLQAPPASIR
jgi:hydrogenase maturation protease